MSSCFRMELAPSMFNPLAIVSKDGFEMTVEVKVIIRVQPEQAPHMVARIGTTSMVLLTRKDLPANNFEE